MQTTATGDRSKIFTRRAAFLGGAKLFLGLTLAARMYYLQVIQADRYRMLADENRISIRLLPPPRGPIFDRYGTPLAVNEQNFRALVVAELSPDMNLTLDALSQIMPVSDHDRSRILREVKRHRKFVPVAVRENLTWDEMAQIQVNAPDLPGVVIDEGLTRYYPYRNHGAHLLGYVSSVSEEDLTGDPLLELPGFRIGKAGIERVYDMDLRGKGGASKLVVDALGRVQEEHEREEGLPGASVTLSIDMRLQKMAAERLGEESGSVVVLDIHTGEVLAMVSSPAYDPNAFNRGLNSAEWNDLATNLRAPLINKPLAGQYAPGSTFKPATALAALESGIVRPDFSVFCPGYYELGNNRFHCWKEEGHGHVDMVRGLQQSCDVYFYEISRRIGIDRIAEMAKRLGIGQEVGIDLPGERPGLMPSKKWKKDVLKQSWQQGETLIAGIGQGYVLSTPLQLAVMTARIANGGFAVTPHLTREVGGAPPKVAKTDFPSLGISRTSLDIIHRGMNAVVNEPGGTALRSQLLYNGMTMAGKTGTAQVRRITKAERDAGLPKTEERPWEERDNALFIAFAPVSAPRYAISVVVEHGGSGSGVAAPVARDIMREVLRLAPPVSSAGAGHVKGRDG